MASALLLVVFVLGCLFLTTCGAPQDAGINGQEIEPTAGQLTGTATPDHGVYWQAWEEGPHAQTYSLEKGPNTYCARCHSPANWDPAATIDPPPNCVSCKFAFEPEPRVAAGNPLVPEEEWESIGCEVCHRQDENGVILSQIAWHDPVSGYYETVPDATALCSRCHRDTETLRHSRSVGEGAHADFVCTDCHDAHSTAASCADAGCHDPADAGWQESHDEHHGTVDCVACHDGSGLAVGPTEDRTTWMAFRTTELLGRANTEPYQSHQLQRTVNCQRCHYEDNPWELRQVKENE